MPFCPAKVHYKVTFENGNVEFPVLPGSANVTAVAAEYAKSIGTSVVSIEKLY